MDLVELFRDKDRYLEGILAEHVEAVSDQRPDVNLDELRTFLHDAVMPQLHAEELHILPGMDAIQRDLRVATSPVSIEVNELKAWIHRIESQIFALETAPTEDVAVRLWADMRVLLIGFQAVMRLHLKKIEQAYAPALDEWMTNAQKERAIAEIEVEERLEALT